MKKIALKIEKSKEKITPFGGSILLSDLYEKLKLREYIDSLFPAPGSNRGYKASDKILAILSSFMLGGSNIKEIDKLREDKSLRELLSLEKFPESSTINRWLLSSGKLKKSIKAINKLLDKLTAELLKKEGITGVTMDQDATYIEANKDEAKYCYKGNKAYSILMSFISGIGICIATEMREGNVSPSKGLLEQLKMCNEKLKKLDIKLLNYRADSASYNAEIINYCEEERITYFIGCPLDKAVKEIIGNIEEGSWEVYEDKYGIQYEYKEVSESIHSMNKSKKSFRIIVVREKIKDKEGKEIKGIFQLYKYRVIITNSESPANEAVNFYNQRGECEYYIKEAKYGYNLKNLPCGELGGNSLWSAIGVLGYNLMIYLKRLVLEKGLKKVKGLKKNLSFKNKEAKSIRYLIFSIAGKLVIRGGRNKLKLCCSEKMIELFNIWRLEIQNL